MKDLAAMGASVTGVYVNIAMNCVLAYFNYEAWKKNCDSYFFLKHRKEHRGIGGIFFEYKNRK